MEGDPLVCFLYDYLFIITQFNYILDIFPLTQSCTFSVGSSCRFQVGGVCLVGGWCGL
jgi:hypothetical protein